MPTAQITVTGRIGPGDALAAQVLADVTNVEFDINANVLRVTQVRGRVTHIDFSTIATTTVTITSSGATKSTVFVSST